VDTIILGDGPMGRAIEAALSARAQPAVVLGRPADGHHAARDLAGTRLAFEASRGDAVAGNVAAVVAAGCRRLVIATTGWDHGLATVDAILQDHGAAAVWAPNFSLGVMAFGRLVALATGLIGVLGDFDPYLVEWHRRSKRDRPSGTAGALARQILDVHPAKTHIARGGAPVPEAHELEVVSIRAGSSPGMHLEGFDAPGETIELRLTARDRSAYAAGALAAADWLASERRPGGLHPFDLVTNELFAGGAVAAPAA
jgi:4-hydroxy-tetrahydrodipicolinate reductase